MADDTPLVVLEPVENIALTFAVAQLRRGDYVSPNVAAQCVTALMRLTGREI